MTAEEKYRCWKVRVYEAALPALLSELGKNDVAWRTRWPGSLVCVVLYKENAVLKSRLEKKLKAAVSVKPWSYEEFRLVKGEYVQFKWKSAEKAAYWRSYNKAKLNP